MPNCKSCSHLYAERIKAGQSCRRAQLISHPLTFKKVFKTKGLDLFEALLFWMLRKWNIWT